MLASMGLSCTLLDNLLDARQSPSLFSVEGVAVKVEGKLG